MIRFIRHHRIAVVAFLLGLLTLASGLLAVVAFLPLLLVGHSALAIPPAVALLLVEILVPLSFLLIVPTWQAVKKSEGKDGGRWWVVLGLAGVLAGTVLGASVPMSEAAGEGYHQAQIGANLRRIGLALLQYNDEYGHLPPPVVEDEAGRPLYSWRVALLPFLGEEALYREFHLDEPWDSPHNRALLARMPAVYSAPGAKARQPHTTFYQYVVGEATVFRGPGPGRMHLTAEAIALQAAAPSGAGEPAWPQVLMALGNAPRETIAPGPTPVRIPASFLNGTSNTILVAEAGQDVPWTKPADLPFDPELPLPALGSCARRRILLPANHWSGVHFLKADGFVTFIPAAEMPKAEQAIRRAIDQTISDSGWGGW